jgi:hypothetical protein
MDIKEYLLYTNQHLTKDITEEEIKESIQTDEIWEMIWFPETPVGSYKVCAPTLEKLLEKANLV